MRAPILFLVLMPSLLWAQEQAAGFRNMHSPPEWFLGASFSPDMAWATSDDATNGTFGFHAGLRFRLDYAGPLGLETGFLLSRSGFGTGPFSYVAASPDDPLLGAEIEPHAHFYGLTVPALVSLRLLRTERVNLYAEGGIYGTYLAANATVTRVYADDELRQTVRETGLDWGENSRWQAQGVVRVLAQLRASQWWVMQLGPEYRHGLTPFGSRRLHSFGLNYSLLYTVKN